MAETARRQSRLMHARSFEVVELGYEPPISLGPVPPDRRAAARRWFAATALMGVAAGLMVSGAVWTAGGRARAIAAPVVVTRRMPRQAVEEGARGDLAVRRVRANPADAAVRIERLADSGSVKPFTRVSARLAQIDADPPAPPPPPASPEPVAEGPPAPLPPIILYGQAQPTSRPAVVAYADAEPSLTAPRAIVTAVNITNIPRAAATPDVEKRVVVARANDTLAAILSALGATTEDAQAIVAAFAHAGLDAAPLAGGEVVTILERRDPHGQLLKIGVERPSGGSFAVARADSGEYRGVVAEPSTPSPSAAAHAAPNLPSSGASLRDSLYALARSHHVEEAVFAEFLQLCGRDFDLERPLGAADEAELIYQSNDLDTPELSYVALTAQGRTHHYYRFTSPEDGGTDFYDDEGHSATKFLLRKPVLAGKLGDGFGWRIHPVLHDRRFHEGVDYAAPYGSPIASAGEGVVEKIAVHWGYGKYIRIRHDLGYETTYAHVSGFPRGLKVGDRVRQGETIAYVGSTGLSTGPHLYYEVNINGHNVDPLSVHLAAGRMLQGAPLAAFERTARGFQDLAHAPGAAEFDQSEEFGAIPR
jgi:murein DD-endopeptidase MepM/ murein hydrolase activator NlpD